MVAKQVFDHSLRESGKRFSSSLKASNRYSAAELEYSGVHDLASIDQSVLNHLAASDTLAAQRLRMLLAGCGKRARRTDMVDGASCSATISVTT